MKIIKNKVTIFQFRSVQSLSCVCCGDPISQVTGTWWIPGKTPWHSMSSNLTNAAIELIEKSQFSCSVMSDSFWPYELQHARLSCSLPIPRACSNSCPLSQWCHPTISYCVVPFSSCLQSFLVSWFFPMSQFFASGGQSGGISAPASVLSMNIQDWFPWRLTG